MLSKKERDKLRVVWDKYGAVSKDTDALFDTCDQLEAERDQLRELMPCGHSRAEWVEFITDPRHVFGEGIAAAVPYCRACQLEAERTRELREALFDPQHHKDCLYQRNVQNCCGVRIDQVQKARTALQKEAT